MRANQWGASMYPKNKREFISYLHYLLKSSISNKAKGFINLSQTIYIAQWVHSAFRLHDNYSGVTFCEKQLFYLKVEKAHNEKNLSELERLCADARIFVEKNTLSKLWKPAHSKMLAVVYKHLSMGYLNIQDIPKAIENLEHAERTLIMLLKDYPTYSKSVTLLEEIQTILQKFQ